MKRTISLLLTVVAFLMLVFTIASCTKEPHVHKYSDKWSYDVEFHWHAATCGHTHMEEGKEAHSFGVDKLCTVCGFDKTSEELNLVSLFEFSGMLGEFNLSRMTIKLKEGESERELTRWDNIILDYEGKYLHLINNTIYRYEHNGEKWIHSVFLEGCDDLEGYLINDVYDYLSLINDCDTRYFDFTFEESGEGAITATLTYSELEALIVTIEQGRITSVSKASEGCTVTLVPIENELSIPYVESNGLEYALVNGAELYYKVTGIGSCTDTYIVIPSEHEGLPVKAIADEAFKGENITMLTVDGGVTNIGRSAFEGCEALRYVYLGDSVVHIGERAFAFIVDRADIYFTDSIRSIGKGAFDTDKAYAVKGQWYFTGDVNKYATIDFGDSDSVPNLNHEMHINGERPTEIVIDTATYISSYAFSGLEEVTTYRIGAQVKSLGESCITSYVDFDVYYEGTLLEFINLEFLGDYWSNPKYRLYCAGELVESVTFPESFTEIPNGIFLGCISLKNVFIPDNVTKIGAYAFSSTVLESIRLPDTLEVVEKHALDSWGSEESLAIFTFYDKTYYIGSSENPYMILVGNVDRYAVEVSIHPDTKIIMAQAFTNWNSLESLAIPDGVKYIGEHAFEYCYSLKHLVIPSSVKYIGEGILYSDHTSALEELTIPFFGKTYKEEDADDIHYLAELDIKPELTGITFFKLKKITLLYASYIADEAFAACPALEEVVIPETAYHIGIRAFRDCPSLKSVKLENIYAWHVSKSSDLKNSVKLSHNDLKDTQLVAFYLSNVESYCNYYWQTKFVE